MPGHLQLLVAKCTLQNSSSETASKRDLNKARSRSSRKLKPCDCHELARLMDGSGCVRLWGREGAGGVVTASKRDICEARASGRSSPGMRPPDSLCEGHLVSDPLPAFGVGRPRHMGLQWSLCAIRRMKLRWRQENGWMKCTFASASNAPAVTTLSYQLGVAPRCCNVYFSTKD